MGFFKKSDEQILSEITELTLLDARAISNDIYTLINVARSNHFYGVCINPCFVKTAKDFLTTKEFNDLAIISVVGFPLGANTTASKVAEVKQLVKDGVDEVDVVINIGKLRENDFEYIRKELKQIVKSARGRVVKAIIETCYLTKEQIVDVCKICMKARVDFIKTSTGLGTRGATVEDVTLIQETVKKKCQIKASGGIRTKEQAQALINAGATRIGTSRVIV